MYCSSPLIFISEVMDEQAEAVHLGSYSLYTFDLSPHLGTLFIRGAAVILSHISLKEEQ
jgi:hypothetical protein